MEINFNNIQVAFDKMLESWWNIDKEKKWHYFFFNKTLNELSSFSELLIKEWYKIEFLWETDDWDEYILIISKVEILTPSLLNNKNISFNDRVKNQSIDLYDWWDVEEL